MNIFTTRHRPHPSFRPSKASGEISLHQSTHTTLSHPSFRPSKASGEISHHLSSSRRRGSIPSGFSLIELLLVMGLLTVFMPGLVGGLAAARTGKVQQSQRLSAMGLLKEGEEAVRLVRDYTDGWDKIISTDCANPNFCHPEINISLDQWQFIAGQQSISLDGSTFTRSVTMSDVFRDGSGNLDTTGTLDPSTKKIDVEVSWSTPHSSKVNSTFYISRFTNTALTSSGTILPLSGYGDWCDPSLSITNVDLSGQGVPNAISATQGRVFAATGNNASGVSLADVLLTEPPAPTPAVATVNGTFDGYKTNGVFGDSDYAYIATDNNFKEIVIVDLNNKDVDDKFQLAGTFDAPGMGDGDAVFVEGNYGYMTSGNIMYNFNKVGSSLPLDSNGVSLDGPGKKIRVVGGLAFVVIDASTNQLNLIDVSDPTDLKKIDSISVDGQEGRDVFTNPTSTRAYLVTGESSAQAEFFIINIDNTSGDYKAVYGTYDTTGMDPKGVTIVAPKKGIIVGLNGFEYQVIDLSDENNIPPTPCGTLNIDTGINGVSSILTGSTPPRAYSHIITSVHAKELQLIEGGSGAPGGSGMFESATFDGGHEVAFNSFSATIDPDISYEFSIKQEVAGSCSSVTFSDSDYVQFPPGPLPLSTIGSGYTNPGQCMRYRVINSASTQISYSLIINYSP